MADFDAEAIGGASCGIVAAYASGGTICIFAQSGVATRGFDDPRGIFFIARSWNGGFLTFEDITFVVASCGSFGACASVVTTDGGVIAYGEVRPCTVLADLEGRIRTLDVTC
jgi:hypothetical protein